MVCSDSTYSLNGISKWIFAWRRRGWQTAQGNPVANRQHWEKLWQLVEARKPSPIYWRHVLGHAGNPGNERADEIATSFADGLPTDLYRGPVDQYSITIDEPPEQLSKKSSSKSSYSKSKAFSYLSLVGGQPARHSSWLECESRVKGVSAAKFKKSKSRDDEAQILKSWGFDSSDLIA